MDAVADIPAEPERAPGAPVAEASQSISAPYAGRHGVSAKPMLFLSHAGADTEAARALKRRLEEAQAAARRGSGGAGTGSQGLVRQGRPARRHALAGAARAARGAPCHRLRRLCRLQRRGELGRGRGAPCPVARDQRRRPLPLRADHRQGRGGQRGAARLRAAIPRRARRREQARGIPEAARGRARP